MEPLNLIYVIYPHARTENHGHAVPRAYLLVGRVISWRLGLLQQQPSAMTTMPSLADKPSQQIPHERRDMPVANRNATLIVGLALLVVVLWLGILMLNLQLKLRRLDREASVDLGACNCCRKPSFLILP